MRTALVIETIDTGLALYGDCDVTTTARLERALRRMEYRRTPFDLDASMVTFADSHGLAPIAESVRRSRELRRPELRLLDCSRSVLRVFGCLEVAIIPFGLQTWDAAMASGAGRVLTRR